jgi:hypothetical protein
MQQRSLFLKLLCVLDALLKLLESYYGTGLFSFFRGLNYRAPWRDFTGAMAPLKSEGLLLVLLVLSMATPMVVHIWEVDYFVLPHLGV